MFLGPTGVGKTELAKALAEAMFGDEKSIIRIDMSEYMERHTVARLVGSPPGYVGYEEGGQMTEIIKHRPYSLVLFDEIEKAHPEVFNILLQILDNGRLTDGKGRTVNFRNTIIIMTSNVGSEFTQRMNSLGFATSDADSHKDLKDKTMEALRKQFRPEFLNRVDDIIFFNSLSRADIAKIVDIQVRRVVDRLGAKGVKLTVTAAACKMLVDEGFSAEFGARPLKRAIEKLIVDPLSERMIEGKLAAGAKMTVSAERGKIVLKS
jgi:ATP-dependent Clp protease ATP-binding subunit ClpC